VLLPVTLAGRLLQRRGTSLLRTSAVAALVAVALGVASLVVVLALMNGYSAALRSGILAGGGHLVAMYPAGLDAESVVTVRAKVRAVPGVRAVGEVLYLPALLFVDRAGAGAEVVTLKASGLSSAFAPAASGSGGPLPIALGSGLARRMAASEGARVSLELMLPGHSPVMVPGRVARVFHTGLVELDDRWVAVRLEALAARVAGVRANGVEVELDDPDAAPRLSDAVERAAGKAALVTTWQETNRNLFAALLWQKISLGILLSLVVGVGAFEVASSLVVLVTEKRRQLGILIALGGSPALLRGTVLAAAGALGIAGVLTGALAGTGIAAALTALRIPSFPSEIASIYMVQHIPFIVRWSDLAVVTALGVAEVVVAALLPARRVSRWQAAEVLRWV
jgi:lipoprotein-releasing system permease protein